MVGTGLQNNELFPTITLTLLIASIAAVYNAFTGSPSEGDILFFAVPVGAVSKLSQLVLLLPLLVALWGASLFKPGNTGAGFATSSGGNSNKSNSSE